jgi:transcriptional regulator with XRE-family HTH domain
MDETLLPKLSAAETRARHARIFCLIVGRPVNPDRVEFDAHTGHFILPGCPGLFIRWRQRRLPEAFLRSKDHRDLRRYDFRGSPIPIGAHLRHLREDAGLTQAAAADALGIAQPKISEWENDHVRPRQRKLAAIAALYEANFDDLLFIGGYVTATPQLESLARAEDLQADIAPPRLRRARRRAGLSRIEVARALDVSESFVVRIEEGTEIPKRKRLRQLATLYKASSLWP